jgi:hypothetical protein
MEGVPAETQEAAREIFLQGNVLIKDTLFAKAATKYREAIAMWQHPAFYFNLAIAQLALDQPIEAHHSLEQALRYGEAPLGARRYRQARIHLQRLDRELALIEVVCDEPGATVTLDGKLLFEAPGRHEGHVRPGGHQLVAHKAGYLTETRQLVLSPGQRTAVAIELKTFEHARESSRRWAAWKPWAVAGASTVFVAGAAYFDRRASRGFDGFGRAFSQRCPDGCDQGQVPAAWSAELERAESDRGVAAAGYVTGGLVLATGAILVYLNRERVIRVAAEEDADTRATITITPVLVPRGAGIGAGLHF